MVWPYLVLKLLPLKMKTKSILYLGNKLSQGNFNITTIDALGEKLKSEGFVVDSFSNKRNKSFKFLSMLCATFNYRHYDYLLIDTYSTSAFWFAYFPSRLARLFKLKYILILHGGNLGERLLKTPKLSRRLFSQAYMSIAPSQYMYDLFKQHGFKNIKCIPNFINIKDYKFKKRKSIKPKILWVRAFDKIYNPLMAIKTLEKVLQSHPSACLSMVGPIKDKSFKICKNYAETNNLPVIFTGQLSKKEWLNYAKDFDIFINTTTIDNTPVSVIEAMALGLPVVSTNVGGIPFLIENNKNGKLVNSNAVQDMCRAINELLQNPEFAQKLSKNARKLVEDYDWEIIKYKWKEVLK